MCGTDDVRCSASHALPEHPMPEQSCYRGVACFSSTMREWLAVPAQSVQASQGSAGPQVREMTAANLLVEKAARSERLTVFKATLVRSLGLGKGRAACCYCCSSCAACMSWLGLGFPKAVSSWVHTRHQVPRLRAPAGVLANSLCLLKAHTSVRGLSGQNHSGAQTR